MSARDDAELADPRVSYALRHENDGPAADCAALVASRAARAMRDGNRHMDGSPRDGLTRISHSPQSAAVRQVFDERTAAAVRQQLTEREREQLAAARDMTPGAPHPDPRLAASGWQASDHGTYIRRPAVRELEREAG